MPAAIAPSRPGLGWAGAAGPTVCDTSRSFFSWATSAVRWRSLSSVEMTLSSERASSAWLAGVGAEAASAADAADAGDAVALLIRLCNAGITGVPAARAAPGAATRQMTETATASHTHTDHAASHEARERAHDRTARAETAWQRANWGTERTAGRAPANDAAPDSRRDRHDFMGFEDKTGHASVAAVAGGTRSYA